MDDARLEQTTGRTVAQWAELLDARGCRELDHTAIARLVPELLPEELANKGWWAQSVSVEYEKLIGRRVVGQTCAGDFQVSVSKSWPGSRDEALAAWQAVVAGLDEFDGLTVETPGVSSRTEKWSRWRMALADGSRVVAEAYDKPAADTTRPARAAFAVTHQKLGSAEEVARWRAVWKSFVGRMA